eukprot:1264376-Rhodomonas_salina.1
MVCSSRFTLHGFQCRDHASWFIVQGSWYIVHGSGVQGSQGAYRDFEDRAGVEGEGSVVVACFQVAEPGLGALERIQRGRAEEAKVGCHLDLRLRREGELSSVRE